MSNSSFCLTCKIKSTCKAICKELEAILPKPQGGKNGRKLRFYDPMFLESMANSRAFRIKFGGRKQPNIED